jgi:hypothetical protein
MDSLLRIWPVQLAKGRGYAPIESQIIQFTQPDGARWIMLADAATLLVKAVTSLRDICAQKQYVIYCADRADLITALKQLRLIKPNAGNVALIRLTTLKRLCADTGAIQVVIASVQHVIGTSLAPPPQRFDLMSSTALALVPPVCKYAAYVFPSSLPIHPELMPEDMREQYALRPVPGRIKRETQTYMEWSAAPINTERSVRYVGGVQSTTLEKVPQKIEGFMGFISRKYAVHRDDISFSLYENPRNCADFISYLVARCVGLGHLRCVVYGALSFT